MSSTKLFFLVVFLPPWSGPRLRLGEGMAMVLILSVLWRGLRKHTNLSENVEGKGISEGPGLEV
jgi:hypothetical protein